jgi:hypothetical protein
MTSRLSGSLAWRVSASFDVDVRPAPAAITVRPCH